MSRRQRVLRAVCFALPLLVPAQGVAQARREEPVLERIQSQPLLPGLPEAQLPESINPAAAFAASAAVPGAAQYLLAADRWVPYVAVEVWGWVSYLKRRHDGRQLEGRYRDLAWSVARRVSVGARRDTVFEYYEAMSHFAESGAYDADPQLDGVQPERDPSTFNGDLWLLARALYIPGGVSLPPEHPDYQRALAYYETRAIPPGFAWAWGESNLEQQAFRGLIRESDEAFRDATRMLGIILANHVVSAVDALVLARLRAEPGESRIRLRFDSSIERHPAGLRWSPSVRVVF